MTVAYKLIHETFTSRVTLDRNKLEILVEYLEGPFRKMNNRWSFQPGGRQAPATSNFLSLTNFAAARSACLMGAMFETAFRRFSAAFERRADEVYGAARLAVFAA